MAHSLIGMTHKAKGGSIGKRETGHIQRSGKPPPSLYAAAFLQTILAHPSCCCNLVCNFFPNVMFGRGERMSWWIIPLVCIFFPYRGWFWYVRCTSSSSEWEGKGMMVKAPASKSVGLFGSVILCSFCKASFQWKGKSSGYYQILNQSKLIRPGTYRIACCSYT